MGWNIPAVPNPGDVATVANWAQKVVDSLNYLHESYIKISTYTGDDNISGRQIVVGFKCNYVSIRTMETVTEGQFDCFSVSGSFWHHVTSGAHSVGTEVKLHASDGFWIGNGYTAANVSGRLYNYIAIAGDA